MTCNLDNVTADGTVCGSVELINGELVPTDWREIHLDSYYCECGEYFTASELAKHLGVSND